MGRSLWSDNPKPWRAREGASLGALWAAVERETAATTVATAKLKGM